MRQWYPLPFLVGQMDVMLLVLLQLLHSMLMCIQPKFGNQGSRGLKAARTRILLLPLRLSTVAGFPVVAIYCLEARYTSGGAAAIEGDR